MDAVVPNANAPSSSKTVTAYVSIPPPAYKKLLEISPHLISPLNVNDNGSYYTPIYVEPLLPLVVIVPPLLNDIPLIP